MVPGVTEGQISAEVAAKLIMVTDRHLRRLVADGWIKKAPDGGYSLVNVVQGHINYLKDETRRNSRQSATSHSQDVRAREVEQRIAIKDRKLIALDEAIEAISLVAGWVRAEIEGMPASFTRDLKLRRQLETKVDDILSRLAAQCAKARQALRTGQPALDPVAEDDA